MKKEELLKYLDSSLLDRLFHFCYARTRDSFEAQDLCSDILFALLKTSYTPGEVQYPVSFIWRLARNVYADFSRNKKRRYDLFSNGMTETALSQQAEVETFPQEQDDLLLSVYQRIAFLSRVYRETMILRYIDGLSIPEIAKLQQTQEGTVRQRLFAARQKLKEEVQKMEKFPVRPLPLDHIDLVLWGTGDPRWDDPRTVCTRMLSKHILCLCKEKPMTALEIAEMLNVPTVYIEDELELLSKGEHGFYGLLQKTPGEKFALNFILLSEEALKSMQELFLCELPKICDILLHHIETHRASYLSFPYLNQKADWNLILWQQIFPMVIALSNNVERILAQNHFADQQTSNRPFSVCGYLNRQQKNYGGGWDGVDAENVCGFAKVHMDNIYISCIQKHFGCGLNIATDPQIQLTLRAIEGLHISHLTDAEKEHAAKAIECGYLSRQEEILYPKILVNDFKDQDKLFAISRLVGQHGFDPTAQNIAKKLAALIRRHVPRHLLSDWKSAYILASLPLLEGVVEHLIEQGILTPPANGIGAEGCWMSVEK